jgi:hypothetical protein
MDGTVDTYNVRISTTTITPVEYFLDVAAHLSTQRMFQEQVAEAFTGAGRTVRVIGTHSGVRTAVHA